jgi:purine-nucleoside phosphorylase
VKNTTPGNGEIESAVSAAVDAIREHAPFQPEIAVVLGSGLGGFTESLSSNAVIQTASVPGYPRSTVEGHKGELVFCTASGRRLLAFRGRVHFYESGSVNALLFPIRVAAALGARILIITNAAGGVNRTFVPGDLMLISDHIDLTGESFELGHSKTHGAPYDQQLIRMAENTADKIGVRVVRGVYAGLKGPSYETAAEIEMIHRIGGDAVGMSTVLEVALAASLGMHVLGISCITNKATGTSSAKLNHEEVTVVANQVREQFSRLLMHVIKALPPA